MRRLVALLIASVAVASVASAHPRRPYKIDEPRVKAVVADFLGVPAGKINWADIDPPEGPANWGHPIRVTLPDPPTSRHFDSNRRVLITVDPKWYYLRSAQWDDRWPPEGAPADSLITLAQARKLAWSYAIGKSHCSPSQMKLRYEAPFQTNQRFLTFEWQQWDGDLNTGTRINIGINATPPGQVYSYFAHISRPWPRSAFRISREVAIEVAKQRASAIGLEEPRLLKCDPYLSSQWVERPHWELGFDYANRWGGFLYGTYVDAGTGRIATPRR